MVEAPERGYGAALAAGIAAARGRYVIMGDADDSYDFSRLEAFVEKLRAGYPLVMGNRFKGGIRKGAGGHDICFVHPRANDEFPLCGEGVLIELVQAPPEVITALEA